MDEKRSPLLFFTLLLISIKFIIFAVNEKDMYAIDTHVLVRDGETPLNVLKLFDVSEYNGESVGISVVILRNLSVVYDDNGAYSLPQGGTYEYSLPVNGDVVDGGDYVVECFFKNLGTNDTTVVRRSFTLEYTPPVVNPYITVDGLRSKLYGGATMTGVASVLSKSFIHTLPQGGTVVNSDNYEIDGIYSGVHSLVVRYDLSITTSDYVLYDSVYGSQNVIAYKLDAESVFGDVSNYRALYERTSNLGLKRQMHTTLKTIEAWADDYHNSLSVKDSLTAYEALTKIYIALNGNVTPTVEQIEDVISQQFSDVKATALKSVTDGGDIPADDYNWFKQVYSSLVDGSVKSYIKGLINQLKSLASRVLNLEYVQTVIYTVPGDCTSVTITQFPDGRPLNIQEGEKVEITIRIPYVGSPSGGRLAIQLNGVSSNIYRYGSAGLIGGVPLAGSNILNALYQPNFTLIRGEVLGMTNTYQQTTSGTWTTVPQLYAFTTEGLNATQITSIRFYVYNGTVILTAGEKIIIKIYRQ